MNMKFKFLTIVSIVICVLITNTYAATDSVNISYKGKTYNVPLGVELNDFSATLQGGTITDPEVLTALYAGGRAVKFVRLFVGQRDFKSLYTDVVTPLEDLNHQLQVIKGLEFANKMIGEIGGGILGAMAVTYPYTTTLSLKTISAYSIKRTFVNLGSLSTVVSITADALDYYLLAGLIESGKVGLSKAISDAMSVATKQEKGDTIALDDAFIAANSLVDSNNLLRKVGELLSADPSLNAKLGDDVKVFFTSLAGGILGVFYDVGELPPAGKILTQKWWSPNNVLSGLEAAIAAAEAIEAFMLKVTGGAGGYPEINPYNLEIYHASFLAKKPIPIDNSLIDLVKVTTGPSKDDVSDARLYVNDGFFVENNSHTHYFTVRLSEALPHPVFAKYSIYSIGEKNSATINEDFHPIYGETISIPAGKLNGLIPISINDDNNSEALSEIVRLAVYDPQGASFKNGVKNIVAKGLILDNEFQLESLSSK